MDRALTRSLTQSLETPLPGRNEDLVDEVITTLRLYRRTWDDEVYSRFLKSFNRLLEETQLPVYNKNILEKLSEDEPLPIWGVEVDDNVVRELLISVIKAKSRPDDPTIIAELENNLEKFLREVGIENPDSLIETCRSMKEAGICLAYTSIVVFIKATNP